MGQLHIDDKAHLYNILMLNPSLNTETPDAAGYISYKPQNSGRNGGTLQVSVQEASNVFKWRPLVNTVDASSNSSDIIRVTTDSADPGKIYISADVDDKDHYVIEVPSSKVNTQGSTYISLPDGYSPFDLSKYYLSVCTYTAGNIMMQPQSVSLTDQLQHIRVQFAADKTSFTNTYGNTAYVHITINKNTATLDCSTSSGETPV